MARDAFNSPEGPKAIGPYSHAVWAGELLFLSGQIPIDPSTGKLVEGGVDAQAKQVFANIEAILKCGGLSLDDVVKATVYLSSMADFQAVNAVCQTRFAAPFPARTAIAVAALPMGALVEIEVVAKR
jgi:2-iminobutanoate/2-iminopropanoate deaminase